MNDFNNFFWGLYTVNMRKIKLCEYTTFFK